MRNRTNLDQEVLHGDSLAVKDSDTFGNIYLESLNNNLTIITFQNVGQQPYWKYNYKSIETSKAFRASHANITLYAEISLNKQKLPINEKFNDPIKHFSRKSFSFVSSSKYCGTEAGRNIVGGIAITINKEFILHRVRQRMGKNIKGLRKWVYSKFRGAQNQYF